MKKFFAAIISLAALIAACDISGGDFSIPRGVYIAGRFGHGLETQACYWANGRRVALNGYDAYSITISGGKLLIAGYFRDSAPVNDDDESVEISAIINGRRYPLHGCYWVNGRRHNSFYEPEESETRIDRATNAFWINGERIKIDNFQPWAITTGEDGAVYVAGLREDYNYDNNKHIYIFFYYFGGQLFELQDIQEEIQTLRDAYGYIIPWKAVTKIQACDGRVYVFGTYPFNGYWADGERVTLDMPEGTFVMDYAVATGGLYMAGFYGRYQPGDQGVACYWADGERHDLNGSAATAILVVE
jgi:hypothetical protein